MAKLDIMLEIYNRKIGKYFFCVVLYFNRFSKCSIG